MKPVSPVIPGRDLEETIIAEHQDEYQNLPAVVLPTGEVCTRWHLTWRERLAVLFKGDIYLWVWPPFGQPLQPLFMQVEQPEVHAVSVTSDRGTEVFNA